MKKFISKTASAVTSALIAASAVCSGSAFAVTTPNPVISRGVPAYSEANPATASAGNDEHYFSFWFGTTPDYLAYDLSGVPEDQRKSVIAVWYNTSAYDNIGMYANRNMEPSDYTIEVNAAPGGTFPKDGWKIVDTVSDNMHGSRQHLVNFEGYNWIRMNIAKADGEAGKQASINFDIHNVSDGVSDSWIFFGDSITAGGMNNCYGTGFATYINRLDDRFFPIQENGGIGGIKSIDGKEHIDEWLAISPAKFVSIAYGTNDAWGNPNAVEEYYSNTKYMIDAVLAAGKVPVLPKIPGSTNKDVGDNVPLYNAKIDQLYEEYGSKLVQGPDFGEFFIKNPDLLSQDGVHPSSEGYEEMRRVWAETMYKNVYSSETPEATQPAEPKTPHYGDANLDGKVTLGDALAVLQYVANEDKYPLSPEAVDNADVFDRGDGITAKDALTIQEYDVGAVKELPVSWKTKEQ